jgi:3-phenylpropionate/trans-cinnamate dioxygenase ferredoxin reductase subunit
VILVDPDRDAPYDRPNLSKDYLAGKAPEEWIPLRPRGFYEAHDISRVITAATAIDPVKRTVTLEDGPMLEFGALLLATGAAPVRPPIPGSTQSHVHVLRSLVDCRALIRGATAAGHVVIAGASFIGLEAAASLRERGVAVSVVAPEAVPFERTLGADLGRMLEAEHERHGVEFRLGRMLKEIRQSDVVLDDDSVMPADLVLLGVGVRPLLELAQTAGLAEKNGVPVNRYLETRTAGIFAAGDIALHPDPRTDEQVRIEHWVVAQRQGQTAARNILGRQEPFDSVPFFWTNQYGLTVSYTGHAESWDDMRVTGDVAARDCTVRYSRNGSLLAVATVNRDRANLEAELALEAAGRSSGAH